MKLTNFIFALSAVLVSNGVLSGEVGAPYPQLASPAELTVAVAETGASTSWVSIPLETKATAHQIRELKARNDVINAQVNEILQKNLEKKLDVQIANIAY